MTLTLTCYSLSGTVILRAVVIAPTVHTAWKEVRAELVGRPFAGTETVGSISPRPCPNPKGWRASSKWAMILDRDGCEVGNAALAKADGTTFSPTR
jgi:hypothetical protein